MLIVSNLHYMNLLSNFHDMNHHFWSHRQRNFCLIYSNHSLQAGSSWRRKSPQFLSLRGGHARPDQWSACDASVQQCQTGDTWLARQHHHWRRVEHSLQGHQGGSSPFKSKGWAWEAFWLIMSNKCLTVTNCPRQQPQHQPMKMI